MNELTEILERQAAQARPVPNLIDVRTRVDRRRHRARAGRIVVISATLVGALAGLLAVTMIRSEDGTQTASSNPPAAIVGSPIGGLLISGASANGSYPQTKLVRSDPAAASGAYAVVVRRVDGDLGAGNAVITYPVADGLQSDGNVHTTSSSGASLSTLVMSRPGGRILVRSVGLDTDEVTAIANATQVVDGRPVVRLPGSMYEFAVGAIDTERPSAIHETRYGCDEVGEAGALGGLCYTGLTTSPGFEAALYSHGFQPGPPVHGHPSVVSTVGGGNATLAWEPLPGLIAYVGYSGNALAAEQIAALTRLANRSTLISAAEWSASQPQVVTQPNDW